MNTKNKKKTIKITIVSICMIAIIVSAVILIKHYMKTPTSEPIKASEAKAKFTTNDAKKLYYDNYLISYIVEGDIEIGEGTAEDEQGNIYYAVIDDKLKNIKNISDITNLIDTNLSAEMASYFTNLLQDENFNNYLSFNDNLYIKKTENTCDIPEVDEKNITYKIENNNVILIWNEYSNTAFYNENIDAGKWELNSVTHTCQSREQIRNGIDKLLNLEK